MLEDRLLSVCPAGPLDQMRACANLIGVLRDCIAEERVLRRNGVRITPQLCLDALTELELVARLIEPDLGRELMAAHGRFADTTTTTGRGRAPNPDIGRNLQLALGIAAQVVEALSMTLIGRHPELVPHGQRILDRLSPR